MSRKTYVLDSTVLLYDPTALTRFEGAQVVIPLPVLEEIDSKQRLVGEASRNARLVSRQLRDYQLQTGGSYEKGITIENGVHLRIHMFQRNALSHFPLSVEGMRERTLFIAYQLKSQGEEVIFVSKDFLMRLKAEGLGLKTQDHVNTAIMLDELKAQIDKIERSKAEIDNFFKDGTLPAGDVNYERARYCLLGADEENQVLSRYCPKKQHFARLPNLPKDIWGVTPLNQEQRCALDLLLNDNIKLCVLLGQAGTGKTLLALACGLRKVFDEGVYSKILVSRPIMPLGKDIGYLPGSKEEKLYHWMQPIYDNLEFLCGSTGCSKPGEENETLKWITESKKIEMEAVTYIRGRSLPKMFIIIDEAQNLSPHEVKTVISRAGKGTKVILTGDPSQIDAPYLDKHSNGLSYTIEQFNGHPIFGYMFLDTTERSELAAMAADIL